MGKWETIDVCDALELLSPVFESEEVNCLTFFFSIKKGCLTFLHFRPVLQSGFSLDYISTDI